MINLFNFKEINFFRAFLIPSVITALSTTIAIEFRFVVDEKKNKQKINPYYHLRSLIYTFFVTLFCSYISFYLIHYFTGYGNSMLHTKVSNNSYNI